MLIEFVAIPGSGKTYLSNELKKYLEKNLDPEKFTIFTRQELGSAKCFFNCRSLKFIERNVKLNTQRLGILFDLEVLNIVKSILKSKRSLGEKKKILYYVIEQLRIYSSMRKKNRKVLRNCIFIFDEGLLHYADLCINDEINSESLDCYFSSLNKIKKIEYGMIEKNYIVIDSQIHQNLLRIDKRMKGRPKIWKKLSKTEVESEMHAALLRQNEYEKFIDKAGYNKYKTNNSFELNGTYVELFDLILKRIKDT